MHYCCRYIGVTSAIGTSSGALIARALPAAFFACRRRATCVRRTIFSLILRGKEAGCLSVPPLHFLLALMLDTMSQTGGPVVVVNAVYVAAAAAAVAAAPHQHEAARLLLKPQAADTRGCPRIAWTPLRMSTRSTSQIVAQHSQDTSCDVLRPPTYLREGPETVVLWPSLRPALDLCHDVGLVSANFVPCSGSEDAVLGRQAAVLRGSLARDETHGLSEDCTARLSLVAVACGEWPNRFAQYVCLALLAVDDAVADLCVRFFFLFGDPAHKTLPSGCFLQEACFRNRG